MFGTGLYLALNDLPETSSYLSQIVLSGTPTTVGGACIVFGCFGMVTALIGMARKGEDAIDLKFSSRGITVRGGHKIPWDAISHVTGIRYDNRAAIQLMWDRADLNRAFVIHLKEPVDIPRLTTKDGVPQLKIDVLRYPAEDYRPLYERTVAEFERRRIPVDMVHRTKET
ncbi:hypothetical protein [Isoptericola cucumis]|uniref:Uncharacterized protein n=1 Tax=Isoptericola cucumis TaxID=1776856 RepID=A0ABQ2B5J0_9MICO|nr:hypothetical protein [Isoptericola cucumis]GGI08341.1 hypothetical protein GCM10007368_20680 [Isoptericola cucumis]